MATSHYPLTSRRWVIGIDSSATFSPRLKVVQLVFLIKPTTRLHSFTTKKKINETQYLPAAAAEAAPAVKTRGETQSVIKATGNQRNRNQLILDSLNHWFHYVHKQNQLCSSFSVSLNRLWRKGKWQFPSSCSPSSCSACSACSLAPLPPLDLPKGIQPARLLLAPRPPPPLKTVTRDASHPQLCLHSSGLYLVTHKSPPSCVCQRLSWCRLLFLLQSQAYYLHSIH